MAESKLSQNQKILLTIRNLKSKIKQLESDQTDPIAVIGVGCRFPGGVTDMDSYWQLLVNGVDAITEIPADRWNVDEFFDPIPGSQGKMYTRWGGFLDSIDQFEPEFFGISPREASSMDPQQRLLLEVAWETMESAGQNPKSLEGTKTGVFVGITANDYALQLLKSGTADHIDAYFGSGNAFNAAAGRISYTFGFQGPCMSIDTACSSSLVSTHLACQSLRNHESNLALAGGVNLILTPESTIATSQAKMLSPSGRCRTFDEGADGYVRGEGCGLILLKRLHDAVKDGNNILATIKGSAVNQDGQSAGFTVPNGLAQQSLIQEALLKSDLTPQDIGYIETHGTGTKLGDPIEIKALNEVFGKDRTDIKNLVVGSVKTNIGHLESASGIAGLIKTLLILQRKEIPRHLHFNKINPHIPIDQIPITIGTEKTPWMLEDTPRRAGVSSFGFSGTNAHIVLEETENPPAEVKPSELPVHLLTLSAKSDAALRSQAARYGSLFQESKELNLANACYTSSRGRAHFQHRLATWGTTVFEIVTGLDNYLGGKKSQNLIFNQSNPDSPVKTAFLFTGQGSQIPQMGRQLYQTQPVFRYWMNQCEILLEPHLDYSLLSVIYGEHTNLLDQTAFTQPALFALEYSLYQLWASWGVKPDAVTGHSVGEYVAACVAGIFSLEDGLKLISTRGKLMQSLPEGGEMMAVFTDEQQVSRLIEPYLHDLSIAAVNAPESVVISGSAASVESIRKKAESLTINTHKLTVSHAFHSPLMEPILESFQETASELKYHAPHIPFISNINGKVILQTDPQHWTRHIRESVRFYDGIKTLAEKGYHRYIEIGPNPVLIGLAKQCLPDSTFNWVASLRRGREDWTQLLESLAGLYADGVKVDWDGFYSGLAGYSSMQLPTYPFQRQRYWKTAPLLWDLVRQSGSQYAQEHINEVLPGNHTIRENALEKLCAQYFINFLVQAKLFQQADEAFTLQEVADRLSLQPQFRQLLARWMEGLTKAGVFKKDNNRFSCRTPLEHQSTEPRLNEVSQLYQKSKPLVSLVKTCGEKMDQALTGRLDALELLFPNGSLDPLKNLYQYTDFSKYSNGIIQSLVSRLSNSKPAETVIRILEIGAGTGSTTTSVLPVLPEDQTRYEFTDITELFLQKARVRFADYSFINFSKLDIESNISKQGFAKGGYDLIIAANVLHATKNLDETMEQVSSLIAPGGFLILWEITKHSFKFDTTFGLVLQELSESDFREGIALISAKEWQKLLLKYGFDKCHSFPQEDNQNQLIDQHVILAQASKKKPGLAAFSAKKTESKTLTLDQSTDYPLLNHKITAAHPLFQSKLSPSILQYLSDHQVYNSIVFPMSGFLEMSFEAVSESCPGKTIALENVQLLEPLIFEDITKVKICQTILTPQHAKAYDLQIYSQIPVENESQQPTWQLHLKSQISQGDKQLSLETASSLEEVRAICTEKVEVGSFYQNFKDRGLSYGPGFQMIQNLWKSDRHALAELSLSNSSQGQTTGYVFHPALLDSCFQSLAATLNEKDSTLDQNGIYMPILIESIQLDPSAERVSFCHAVLRDDCTGENKLLTGDIFLFDALGNLILKAIGFICKQVSRNDFLQLFQPKPDQWLYTIHWEPMPLPGEKSAPSTGTDKPWLIFAEPGDTSKTLTKSLLSLGENGIYVYPGAAFESKSKTHYVVNPLLPEDFINLFNQANRDYQSYSGIVYYWGMDTAVTEESKTDTITDSQVFSCGAVLHLVQALQRSSFESPPQLWLVTRGVQPVNPYDSSTTLLASQVGMARVITNEYPGIHCRRVDLDPTYQETDGLLVDELLTPGLREEDQVAFRNNKRYISRLIRRHPDWQVNEDKTKELPAAPFSLSIENPGILDNLTYNTFTQEPLNANEVEIEIHAAGINFRDVMIAMGVYPGEGAQLGAECAGVVLSTGKKVTNVKTGDKVIAMASNCLGSTVITRKELVILQPDHMSFEEAATVLNVFLSAAYPLQTLAKLKKGDKILVHAASGGVGLAVIQIAQQVGAEVYATAGKTFKRDYLKTLGVTYVGNSRSLDFADELIEMLGGEHIDIVVNSLVGDAIAKSFSVLRPGGCFIELGKTGIWSPQQVSALDKEILYFPIALDKLVQEQPELIAQIINQLSKEFEKKNYLPLPKQVYSFQEVREAFRFMQQANHIGKIVVSLRDFWSTQGKTEKTEFSENNSYLITGGLGGLGLLLAQWLVENGAKELVLIGRTAPSANTQNLIKELEKKGAKILVVQADIACWEDIKEITERISESGKPLKGVFHCAGVLDDRLIPNQDWQSFQKVLAPKVAGTWNLHRLTRKENLDHFVLFSTISAILGTPGQSNHAAANSFMDAMAFYRRSQGLPALSINWGAWSEVGAAAERKIEDSKHARGIGFISPQQGIEMLERVLWTDTPQLAIAPVNWSDFFYGHSETKTPSLFLDLANRRLESDSLPVPVIEKISDVLSRLQQSPQHKRIKILEDHITQRVAEVLGQKDPSSLSSSESFINLGLDSLMAVELKNIVSQDLGGVALPDTLLFDKPNVDALCKYLINKITLFETTPDSDAAADVIATSHDHESTSTFSPVSYPLTPAQKGMWFLYRMNPSMYAFNLTIALKVFSALDREILKETIQELLERHPILKVRITSKGEEPVHTLNESVDIDIPEMNATAISEDDLKQAVVNSARKPFDLEQEPLIRVEVFRQKEGSVLLIVIHHIIFDGLSTGILLDELTQLYSARIDGIPAVLPKPEKSFADYVTKHLELIKSAKSEQHWRYWKQKLNGELPNLDIPTDFQRPAERSFSGASHRFAIDRELANQIYKFCRDEDCTINMFMIAAFQVLLYRYSGQEDILVGSPIAGRNWPGFEKVVGHFISVVVLRGDLSGKPGFRDFLKQIKQTVIEALQHQDYPFPKLVEKLNIPRDPSRTPIFQASLAFQSGSLGLFKKYKNGEEDSSQLNAEPFPIADQEGETDLTLEIFEQERSLQTLLKYNPDLFQLETIIRMSGHFNRLLRSIVDTPAQAVSTLNMLTDQERHDLLIGWQGEVAAFPSDKNISRLFEIQAETSPEKSAVEFENDPLTYQELNDRANQLVHYLKESGVQKQSLVGVYLERSPELIIAILAILKTGCAYLPLDLNHPEERIRYILKDSATGFILTQKECQPKLDLAEFTGTSLDLSNPDIWHQLAFNPEKFYNPESLAYVIYTSGSTGKPKGVMIKHPGFINMIYDQISKFGIEPTDRCLQFASSSFDVSMFEIFLPLLKGATLVIAPDEIVKDGLKLTRYLEEKQVTVATLTASYLKVLDRHPLPTVKTLVIGGEAPDRDIVHYYSKTKNYFNAYGPTEISVCASYHQCKSDIDTRQSIPIGKPIANTEMLLLDDSLSPVPVGIIGEICIAGPGLAKGYLNRPDLTEEAFIPHPYKPDERIYKTGDQGRWLPDETIEFIGRKDQQVKIGGHRIEIQEIEHVLQSLPEVQNAVVLDQKQPLGRIQLVAFTVFRDRNSSLTPSDFKEALSKELPDYMIPSVFHTVNAFPTTASGKIDRNAIRPELKASKTVTFKRPQTETQVKLAGIWETVLEIQEIGIQQNFFELGGNSLLAIQIMSRVSAEFKRELPVAALFQNQTIEEMAVFLRTEDSTLSDSAFVTLQSQGKKPPIFCVHGAGGNVMCFKPLTRKLGKERKFVGIQSTSLSVVNRTIDSMTHSYLQEIRSIQAEGPYVISGWCMGGCVALEIARSLKQMNEEVTLVLIDSFLMKNRLIKLWLFWNRLINRTGRPGTEQDRLSENQALSYSPIISENFSWSLFQDFIGGLSLLNEKPFHLQYNKLKKLALPNRISLVVKELNKQSVFSIPVDEHSILREFKEFEANICALLTYTPQFYEGEIVLIRAAETYDQKGIWKSNDHGFSKITAQLKIREVQGDHFSILNPPNVDTLAKIINEELSC